MAPGPRPIYKDRMQPNPPDLRGKHLHLDCFAGIAGDMFLGALLDLGVPQTVLRDGLARLDLSATYELRIGRRLQMGLSGCDVKVVLPGAEHQHPHQHHAHEAHDHARDHHHDHEHEHEHHGPSHAPASGASHGHRTWASIRALIERSGLGEPVKRRALDIFGRVARAEARLHDRPEDEVAFHEVGAIDSIVDIVGAAILLEHLAPARITSRPVPLGHGFTTCAHGRLPVPAPAALAILAEAAAPVEDGAADLELCTPTGAAIVASCAEAYGQLPAAPVLAAGYGAGDSTLPDRPNLLRVVVLESQPPDPAELEAVVLEANVDDMPGEWSGHLLERLFAAGARDVWFTPIVMKKGRPALTVSALCAADHLNVVGDVLLAESTSIGYRYRRVGRRTLTRGMVEVETAYGRLRLKVSRDGDRVLNAAPEYEVLRVAAARHGVPLKEVHAAALAAYRALAESGGRR